MPCLVCGVHSTHKRRYSDVRIEWHDQGEHGAVSFEICGDCEPRVGEHLAALAMSVQGRPDAWPFQTWGQFEPRYAITRKGRDAIQRASPTGFTDGRPMVDQSLVEVQDEQCGP